MTAAGRVLIVGPSNVGEMAWFVALAYRRLGWQVACFNDRAYVGRGLPGRAGEIFPLIERDHDLTRRRRQLGKVVLERARSCDHVLVVKGDYFRPEDVAAIAAERPVINWHPDHLAMTQSIDCIPHYTFFCPKDSWSTQRLRNMGFLNVTPLPLASDPDVLYGPREEPAGPSFSLVGRGYPYRRYWRDQALSLGVTLHTRGEAGAAHRGAALRAGCFTLNTHHPFDIAGGNQRVFDAAAAGAVQLTEQLPETVRHFKPGTEIATFENREEFLAKVTELVNNRALRDQLARSSHERLREEHTYQHRVGAILGML